MSFRSKSRQERLAALTKAVNTSIQNAEHDAKAEHTMTVSHTGTRIRRGVIKTADGQYITDTRDIDSQREADTFHNEDVDEETIKRAIEQAVLEQDQEEQGVVVVATAEDSSSDTTQLHHHSTQRDQNIQEDEKDNSSGSAGNATSDPKQTSNESTIRTNHLMTQNDASGSVNAPKKRPLIRDDDFLHNLDVSAKDPSLQHDKRLKTSSSAPFGSIGQGSLETKAYMAATQTYRKFNQKAALGVGNSSNIHHSGSSSDEGADNDADLLGINNTAHNSAPRGFTSDILNEKGASHAQKLLIKQKERQSKNLMKKVMAGSQTGINDGNELFNQRARKDYHDIAVQARHDMSKNLHPQK